MENTGLTCSNEVHSTNCASRYISYKNLLQTTEDKVAWVYDAWDNIIKDLKHPYYLLRLTAAQLLCNLSKSDYENRILKDFCCLQELMKVSNIEVARACIQSIWKIAIVGVQHEELVLQEIETLYNECRQWRNYFLIRQDIIQTYKLVYDKTLNEDILKKADNLIRLEENKKIKKKYKEILNSDL